MKSKPEPELPASATHAGVAWIGVLVMLIAVSVLNLLLPHFNFVSQLGPVLPSDSVSTSLLKFWLPADQIVFLALIVMACTALGIFIPDLLWQKVQRRSLQTPPRAGDWARSRTKYAGLIGSVSFIALVYWLAPEYHGGGSFYGHYYAALRLLLPLWALIAPFYIYWVDRRLAQPLDGLWQMGQLVLGRWRGLNARVVWQHLLGWLVKGFFLPLMFTYFCDNLDGLLHYDLNLLHVSGDARRTFQGWYDWSYFTLYFIDVALVSMTYLMSLKAVDTQIRSTEPSAMGWISALLCYQPFWSLINKQYIDYDPGKPWGVWLGAHSWIYYPWACVIVLLVVIYVWGTISFGARFSNLTHRGIITNGPYRFTKHPAYLSKNLSWWLIAMPFMWDGSTADTVRYCLLLVALNLIYYLRAKTEERHLSLDPVYVQYALWMDRHGLLRGLGRVPLIGRLMRWRPTFSAYTPPTPIGTGPV